ncbi:MAG TPA: type II CAAX endopeptidase family protein [Dehalococcoidia bacterium]|nr:type II CAAX endopeptidase family protein [Dehalococcoidia bacterium]
MPDPAAAGRPVTERLGVPWTGRDVLGGIVLLLLALAALLGFLAVAIRPEDGRPAGPELTLGTVVSTVIIEAILLVIAFALGRRRGARARDFGLRPFHPSAFLAAGFVLITGFTINLLYFVAVQAIGLEQLRPTTARDLLPLFGQGSERLIIGLSLSSLIAPAAEELFFRGFVFGGLRDRLGVAGATVVSSIVFSTVHFQAGNLIPIFALGCLLALLYHQTNSIFPPIIVHTTFNAISVLAAYLAVTNL